MITSLQNIVTTFSRRSISAPTTPIVVTGDSIITDTGNFLTDSANFIVGKFRYVETSSELILTDGTNQIVHINHG